MNAKFLNIICYIFFLNICLLLIIYNDYYNYYAKLIMLSLYTFILFIYYRHLAKLELECKLIQIATNDFQLLFLLIDNF